MNKKFKEKNDAMPELFKKLKNSEAFVKKGRVDQKNKQGIYAFIEKGKVVYVGRTRNLQRRLRGHISKTHNSASFAFKRTREIMNKKKAAYTVVGSRQDLLKDKGFEKEFHRQIELIKKMKVKFIEIEDHIDQYLFELYAHLEYKLPTDGLDTH